MLVIDVNPSKSASLEWSRWALSEAAAEWCRKHGIDPNLTFRLEINEAAMTVTVYQYALGADGKHYRVDDEVARREPFTVPITELPRLRSDA